MDLKKLETAWMNGFPRPPPATDELVAGKNSYQVSIAPELGFKHMNK